MVIEDEISFARLYLKPKAKELARADGFEPPKYQSQILGPYHLATP